MLCVIRGHQSLKEALSFGKYGGWKGVIVKLIVMHKFGGWDRLVSVAAEDHGSIPQVCQSRLLSRTFLHLRASCPSGSCMLSILLPCCSP